MGNNEDFEDLKNKCSDLMNALKNLFNSEQFKNDKSELETIFKQLEKSLYQAAVIESLCQLKSPTAFSETKIFIEVLKLFVILNFCRILMNY